ncbi:MAG: ABC transporter permease [Acidobacteriaceae bacterium]
MATMTTTFEQKRHTSAPGIWTPAYSLWLREIVRFYRQRSRVIGVLATPLLFWIVLGSGFANSFHATNSSHTYLAYFFPGTIAMIVLFTAIFSMMSLIQDRNEGFLLSVMAAPVSRSSIVLGKVLGGTTLAAIQGILFLVFLPMLGIHASLADIGYSILLICLISFQLTAVGFAIAWPMDSPQAFHAIINLILLPMWMLSGAIFPISDASGWLRYVMLANPLTYGVVALQQALLHPSGELLSMGENLIITAILCVFFFALSWAVVNRRTHKPAA